MVKEVEMYVQKDQQRKVLIEVRNNADLFIYSVEKSLGEYKDKVFVDVVREIEFVVVDLKGVMQKDDVDLIKVKIDVVNIAVFKIG